MKIPPLLAASALLLVGVMALCSMAVVEHRKARARRPPPEPEVEEPPPAPRRPAPAAEPRRVWRAPPAPEAAPMTELHVHVAGPHGIALGSVEVTAHLRGDREDDWISLEEAPDELGEDGDGDKDDAAGELAAPPRSRRREGTFSVAGLAPGRYDLRIAASGMRTAHADDVAAGVKTIEVALSRAPVLLGAIGALAQPGCSGVRVAWSSNGADGEGGDADVDPDDCTFVAEGLPDTGTVTVVSSRRGRRESALVTVPLSGDPGYLCMEPPCAVEPASVLVYVVDTDHHVVDDAPLTWTLQGDQVEGAMGMSMGTGQLFVHGRRAGQTLALHAERGAHTAEATTLVGSGVTEVVLTLPAEAPGEADDGAEAGEAMGEVRVVRDVLR